MKQEELKGRRHVLSILRSNYWNIKKGLPEFKTKGEWKNFKEAIIEDY